MTLTSKDVAFSFLFFSFPFFSFLLLCQVPVSWLVDASGAGAILSVGLFRHPKLKWAKMEQLFNVDGGVSGGTILSSTSMSLHRQHY